MDEQFQQAQPRQSGGAAKWIIGGCCCFGLVAGGAAVGLVVFGAAKAVEAVRAYEVEVRAFLSDAEAGSYEAAYARFSGPLQEAQTLEQFKQGVQSDPDRFQAQSVDLTGISVDGTRGVSTVRGTVTSRSGKVRQCEFGFVTEAGVKKLVSYQISDALLPE